MEHTLLIHDENFDTEYPSIIHSQTEDDILPKNKIVEILEREGGYVAQFFRGDNEILQITTTVRKDKLGRVPKVGDLACFNPPYYKGLEYGKVTGFNNGGLPIIQVANKAEEDEEYEEYTPKTGFIIIKDVDEKGKHPDNV